MTSDDGRTTRRRIPAGWTSAHPRQDRARDLADALRRQILGGKYPPGRRLDESELTDRFTASRNTVRDALDLLRQEGLIERRRGAGTRVTAAKYGHGLDRLAGLAESLAGHGTVRNRVLAAERVTELPADAADRLELDPTAGGVRLERLRLVDEQPLSLDVSYLTVDVGVPLLSADLAERDVFALIEEGGGVRLGWAEVVVHAATATGPDARLLGLSVGEPIFSIERLTRLADGRPVDTELLLVRADRLALHAVVHRDRRAPAE